MSERNDGGPAFPRKRSVHRAENVIPGKYNDGGFIHDPPQDGMSLRDWLAGMALQGIRLTGQSITSKEQIQPIAEQLAIGAYAIADAMLAERSKHAER